MKLLVNLKVKLKLLFNGMVVSLNEKGEYYEITYGA